MQVQDKRACKSCGASNALDASFCWQCLTRMDAAAAGTSMPAPPAPGQTVGYGRPGMPQPLNVPTAIPATTTTRRKTASVGRIAIGVVVAVALVFFGNRIFGSPDYHVPATLNGVAKATDPTATELESSLHDEAEKYDLSIDSGIYGPSAAPDFVVIVVNGRAAESADSLFDSLIQGMVQAGVTVDGDPVTGTHDGSEFRCVLVHGQGASATACMWLDSDNVGIVLDPGSGVQETEQLLWATHAQVVG